MLAHEHSSMVARRVQIIAGSDPTATVYVHYDGNRPSDAFQTLARQLSAETNAFMVPERARCAWGEFGLVQGTLNALRAIAAQCDTPDYVYLISGSCLPIRPLAELNRFLDENRGTEFIQIEGVAWIKGGLRGERLELFHPFNFRTQRRLFDWNVGFQKRLKIRRRLPPGLLPRFGSQWWCLSWATCGRMLDFLERPTGFRQLLPSYVDTGRVLLPDIGFHASSRR
jgi:hypothetical protein